MTKSPAPLLGVLFTLASCGVPVSDTEMRVGSPAHYLRLDLPSRNQWEGNYGYCGEVSIISAGLYYGQYVSQYDARTIASSGVAQNRVESQLLLGVNDESAAARMHLNHLEWNASAGTSPREFLGWTKQMLMKGYPVVIGIYMNERLFHGDTNPDAGDSDYDHIVPVVGFGTNHALSDSSYYADDTLILSDNGLWSPDGTGPRYFFEYPFAGFPATRRGANSSQQVYSLNRAANYGIALTGVLDPAGETLPVRLRTDRGDEPAIADGSTERPAAVPLELTVTVSGLQPGVSYRLYRYSSFTEVPDSGFNAAAARATRSWEVRIDQGSSYLLRETIQSNETAVYRAVRADSP